MGTRVILLRHGQSTYNALGLYQGCSDKSVLTEAGQITAQQTGAFLKGIQFDAIYTSPLQRAQQTTRQVLGALNHKLDPQQIQVVPWLRETDLPAWQGLPIQKVRQQFAEDYQCWKQTPHQFAMEVVHRGVKHPFYPALDLYDRLQKFWQKILPHHRNQTVLVVAHGGTNRAAIATAIGIPPAHYHSIQQSNCALNVLHFPTGDLSWAQLEAVNLATHVEEALPQPKEGGQGLRLLFISTQGLQSKPNKQLASLLQKVSIQFSLSNNQDDTDSTVAEILAHHPQIVHLEMRREGFPESWQQALIKTKTVDNNKLMTGLIIAPTKAIAHLLGQAIGIDKEQCWRLQIQPENLSVVHYPATNHPPILQTMNVSGIWQQQDLGLKTFAA